MEPATPRPARSLGGQDTHALGGRLSVLTRQKADHVELDGLLHELRRTPPEQQDPVLRRIHRLVFPHAFAEESVLWPALRRTLPDGPRLTLQIEQEHQAVNELATTLEQLEPHDPRRAATLEQLVAALQEDVRDEEDALLPRLQAQATTARLRRLGLAWELVRRIAPTRPHPWVARRPPGNVVAALPLTVLDRARDRIDARLQRRPDQPSPLLEPASRWLTALAHRIERMPPLTHGEHPSTSRT